MTKPAQAARSGAPTSRFALRLTAAAAALAALSTQALAQEAAKGEAQLDTVVVTGVRASLTKSLANKRTNDQVVESVVAEDIGKLPDNNVVEALQRVTGIQVTNRAGGEVGAISIRGLPDIATTWNGRNIFTASGTQVALQDIPSTLVRQIDVYKTRDASQLENGIAGQIDVKSLRPFDFKGAKFSLLARETYLDPAKKWNPQLSGMASNRWTTDAGDFGALVNLSLVKTDYRNESVTPGAMVPFTSPNAAEVPPGYTPLQRIFDNNVWTPGTYTGLPQKAGSTLNFGGTQRPYYLARDAVFMSDVEGQRERPAANIALQWQPNADAVYTFEAMYNGYRDKAFNRLLFSFVDWWGSLGPNPASTITVFPGTNVIKTRVVNDVYGFNSGDYITSATDSYVYALNGKWNFGDRLRLDGVAIANSICFSPNGRRLYYCDSPTRRIMVCDYDSASARVSEPRLFVKKDVAAAEPDGSTIDAQGCLWNAEWGNGAVARYGSDGRLLARYAVPVRDVTCPAFGGPAGDQLAVTTARVGLSSAELMAMPQSGSLFQMGVAAGLYLPEPLFNDD